MAENTNMFAVEIITPDRIFYQGQAEFVEFNTTEGQMGVYKNHIPLTAVLAPGIVNIHESGEDRQAALHAGFVEILGEKVTFLAELAEWPDEIDVDRAKAAMSRARERLAAHDAETDIKRAEFAMKKALIRIEAVEK